jgi:hypothetical protein
MLNLPYSPPDMNRRQKKIHDFGKEFLVDLFHLVGQEYDEILLDPDYKELYSITKEQYEEWHRKCVRILTHEMRFPSVRANKEVALIYDMFGFNELKKEEND